MQYYVAPLEGITGYIFRNVHHRFFPGADKYFIPFIEPKPNSKKIFSSRELNDILPEHNEGMYAVPQILTNKWEDFVWTAKHLQEYGYKEVNINLGCPSKTVVSKKRGAGFLADPEGVDDFLAHIFDALDMKNFREDTSWQGGSGGISLASGDLQQISAFGADHPSAHAEGILRLYAAL